MKVGMDIAYYYSERKGKMIEKGFTVDVSRDHCSHCGQVLGTGVIVICAMSAHKVRPAGQEILGEMSQRMVYHSECYEKISGLEKPLFPQRNNEIRVIHQLKYIE